MMSNDEKKYIDYQPLEKVPGLAFRYFSGEEDYQLKLDLWKEAREFNGFDWVATLEDVKNDEKWRSHFDIYQQQLYVELYGQPLGYMEFNWNRETRPDVRAHYINLCIPEENWQDDVPQLMLEFCEQQAAAMTADLPGDIPDVFQVWKKQKAEKQLAFLKANGYQPSRYFFEMVRPIDLPLDEHPMPAGLEIRPAMPEDFRKIWDANQEAFEDHWGYAPPEEGHFEAWLEDRLFQPQYWKVAWDGDQVAGMVGNFFDPKENKEFNRQRGFTEDIWVRRPWRGLGLAKALIAESIRMFKEMGMEETCLGVDAENPNGALKLYTRMGYEEDPDKTSLVLRKKVR
ncbi:MAG: GNAT family N-acetyltransferase [Anaerolineae bacterium]|jgi:ribosomal protein S18 acetylase RimI-like enzyme|nr:GNAT family N-acetyltransferase [Anaerolineae bacterium]